MRTLLVPLSLLAMTIPAHAAWLHQCPAAMDGGPATVALGLAIHVAVAYGWTTLYALLLRGSGTLRRVVASRARAVAVGAAWGALVWLVMRLVVIPLGRVGWTPIVWRTFVPMLVGHMIVVGQPIALIVRPRGRGRG